MLPVETPLLVKIRGLIRDEVDPDFDFATPGPIPWCPPVKPVAKTRVALITTAGLHLKSDVPFDVTSHAFGDTTFRILPADVRAEDLDLETPYVDDRHIPLDIEVALPLRTLASLAEDGLVGPLPARHAAFCGGMVRPMPGLEESAEALSRIFRVDGTDAAILIPSCPLCVQTACLLARGLEARGFPTVSLSLVPELTRIVGAPRSLTLKFPFGAPCGDPGNHELHRAVLVEALNLLAHADRPGTIVESQLAWKRAPSAPE